MNSNEKESMKVFGGWEFFEGMVCAYPQTNYFRYIAFSNEEKFIIKNYISSKKDTPEFYNKDIDVRLYEDDDDMIFTRCAGNVPFGNQKEGDKNLYVKAMMSIVPKAQTSRIICPKTFISSPSMKEKYLSIKKYLVNEEDISGENFDASFSFPLGIFTFDTFKETEYYKSLFFKDFKDPELMELIYNEFENLPKMKDHLITFKSKDFKLDNNKYYIGFRKVSGHVEKDGKKRWDFYVFYSENFEIKPGYLKKAWYSGLCFDTKEEAEDYKEYLNSDMAIFTLIMYKRNINLGIGSVPYVPYKVDISDLAEKVASVSSYSVQEVIDYITEETKPYGLKAQPKKEK